MIHSKNCEAEYFEAVTKGLKPFEVQQDDEECRFLVGDFLALNEVSKGSLTGRCCVTEISYILRDPRFMKEDFCILGVKPCAINRKDERLFYKDSLYSMPVYDAPIMQNQDEAANE